MAITKIQSESLNLSDNYDFTGTVTGAGGITEVDQWRMTSNLTLPSSTSLITSNLERVSTDGFGKIGTGMSESSGVFTFPSTGIYHISFNGYINSGSSPWIGLFIMTTTNNSSYNFASEVYSGINTAGVHTSMTTNFIFDVTDTSTHKVGFYTARSSGTIVLAGDNQSNKTYFTFIRLGDT